MYYRNRTPSELKAYRKRKLDEELERKKKALSIKVEKQKRKEFKKTHLIVEKFLTISKGRYFINKKSFARLVKEAGKKWVDMPL
jgi:hypothetical protein